jgi:hypothetical protein
VQVKRLTSNRAQVVDLSARKVGTSRMYIVLNKLDIIDGRKMLSLGIIMIM